ncbi:2-hydroxyacid dehydrogenase [Lentzea aerocolonigenes]|uniref:2-hydroxyacid dehydrogenase n=1 Tax=Lentzea aerocolonigenes TaxID=68170 RepID=A0A0F0GCX5_LENAE|nr:hydroxyacid dehydrogenase [Lentzea aerocolonigenes]KJK34567.1 2-hydroxyacid dehydrogenase [Lentzea aerocolonigenes]
MPELPVAVLAMQPWALPGLFPADLLERLRALVRLEPGPALTSFETDEASSVLRGADVLVTGWGCPRIDSSVLATAPRLRAVIHTAGSVKGHVDPAVFAGGITVSSAAQANAVPVAEYTVSAMVFAAKRVFIRAGWYAHDRAAGDWRSGQGTGLFGHTVGIIGASRTGRLVLERLRVHDVRLLVADPHISAQQAHDLGAELVDVDELCRRSELVSLHAPALPETHHLLDARRLALLRDGTTLINTARGSLVDTAALLGHCESGRIDAVLDVTDPEPLPPGHPLLRLPNVLVTPHLAGSQGHELRRLGAFTVAEVARFVRGEPLHGAIRAGDLHRIA